MAECYRCGAPIGSGEPRYRRDVYTGGSRGTWLSRRSFGLSARRYHGPRTLCAVCARKHDVRRMLIVVGVLALVLVSLIGGAVRHTTQTPEPAVAGARTDRNPPARLRVVVEAANIRAEPN